MRLQILSLLAILLMTAHSTWAMTDDDIYQADVPVASQSDQEKERVLPMALTEVLVKASGNAHVLDNPKLQSGLVKASKLAQEFSYVLPTTSNAAIPYLLRVRFDADGVDTLLDNADIPVWEINRPVVLAWMEYEAPHQPTQVINSAISSQIQTLLQDNARRRGLPIILPMMDVTDINLVSSNDIVNMNELVLINAGKRYASDAILIVRVLQQKSDYAIEAKLVMGKEQWGWKFTVNSLADAMTNLIDNVTNTMVGRYAVTTSKSTQITLSLTVTNVKQQGDFSALMQYLQSIASVIEVQPVKVTDTSVLLTLNLRGTKDAFVRLLETGQHLIPDATPTTDASLAYKWNP